MVMKRLSLPSRAPFGVSEGNFAIGIAVEPTSTMKTSRARLMGTFGLREARKKRVDGDAQGTGRTREGIDVPAALGLPAPEGATPRRTATGSGDGRMGILSASPVGNFYIYSFGGKLLQVYDVLGALLKDYIYMGDRLIAEFDHVGGRLLYYTPDQINTTRVVTDQGGSVVYSAVHDPYGGIRQTLVSTYDPQLKFSGKEHDVESELDYFGARYYDRNLYRFISVDPVITLAPTLSDPQLWNRYTFSNNNPIRYADPTGMYGKNFHFNTMVYLAMKAGFSKESAFIIASYCQAVDEFSTTKPGVSVKQDKAWHYVSELGLDEMENMAKESGDLALIGMVSHSIGDSHGAHLGLDNYAEIGLKHIFKQVDKTSKDPSKALGVMQEILDFLLECNNKEAGSMTIDMALCTDAAKKDSDPITVIATAVTRVIIGISLAF